MNLFDDSLNLGFILVILNSSLRNYIFTKKYYLWYKSKSHLSYNVFLLFLNALDAITKKIKLINVLP